MNQRRTVEVALAREQGRREREGELRGDTNDGVVSGGSAVNIDGDVGVAGVDKGTAQIQGPDLFQQQQRDELAAETEAIKNQASAQILLLTEQLQAANDQLIASRSELTSQLAARDVDHAQALEMALAIQAATLAGDPPSCYSLISSLLVHPCTHTNNTY